MTNYRFTVIVCAAMITAISISQITFARDAKLGVDIIDNPSVHLEKPTLSEKSSSSDGIGDIGTVRAALTVYALDMPIDCSSATDSETSLPSSSTYQEADWNMSFRADTSSSSISSLPREQMIDLNGDGLVDYQYVYRSSSDHTYSYTSCVYLNTGSGFERAFICKAYLTTDYSGNITSEYYTGDCAG